MDPNLTFDDLLDRLDRNDPDAFAEVYERCIGHMVAWAARRIGHTLQSKIDPESVAQSAMASFFQRYGAGEYDFDHWGGVMKLLGTITIRKTLNRIRQYRTARRSAAREVRGVDWAVIRDHLDPAAEVVARDFLDPVFEQFSDRDRQIIARRLDGHSVADVAAEFEVVTRTVARVFAAFRDRLRAAYKALADGPPPDDRPDPTSP